MDSVLQEDQAQWAWLGDMELDDVLLGLGAAGALDGAPLAVGFLVNAAHCLDEKDNDRPSPIFGEKLAFLDSFFAGAYCAVLDGYHSAGQRHRSWVGTLSEEQLRERLGVCGLQDEL